jgi:hypothetical protein
MALPSLCYLKLAFPQILDLIAQFRRPFKFELPRCVTHLLIEPRDCPVVGVKDRFASGVARGVKLLKSRASQASPNPPAPSL